MLIHHSFLNNGKFLHHPRTNAATARKKEVGDMNFPIELLCIEWLALLISENKVANTVYDFLVGIGCIQKQRSKGWIVVIR